jgi:hypothetical protein
VHFAGYEFRGRIPKDRVPLVGGFKRRIFDGDIKFERLRGVVVQTSSFSSGNSRRKA